MRDQPDILRHSTPPRLKFWGVVALCLAGAVAAAGIGLRLYNGHRAANWAQDQDVRTVQLIKLSNVQAAALILPGDVQPWINAPDLCPSLRLSEEMVCRYRHAGESGPVAGRARHARSRRPGGPRQADLNAAIANQKLSEVTAKRWDALLAQGAVARQDADAKDSDLAAKNAMVASAKANLDHLQDGILQHIWSRPSTASSPAARWMSARWCWWERPARRRFSRSPMKPDCASMCACRRPMPGP